MTGSLVVLTGPMFSGKSSRLITRVRLAEIEGFKVRAFKPVTDTRNTDSWIHSHNNEKIPAEFIERDGTGLPTTPGVELLAIDEAQFLLDSAVPRILDLVRQGTRIIAAGLDLDAFGRPFGNLPMLMAFANEVVKLTGKCAKCPSPSTRSHRLVRSTTDATILVGGAETYEPRCLPCFDPNGGA